MAASDVITPSADLDELLAELLGHWQRILGEDLVGAYVQGSFALGSGDQESDCDWLVATHGSLTEPQIARLRDLHDEIPTREGHWGHDLEGSYAPVAELASVDHLGAKWLFPTTTATAPSSGTATATGPTPAGSCASTASRWLAPHLGHSCRR